MTYRQTTTNAAGLQADPTKPRYLHQLDGWCGISHHCKAVVVIDPEDRDQVERLTVALFAEVGAADLPDGYTANEVQAALRSLLEPEEPEEPEGIGALVLCAGDGEPSVRVGVPDIWPDIENPKEWSRFGRKVAWSDLPRPITVLSEGWQGES
jgi:hypothetical protein